MRGRALNLANNSWRCPSRVRPQRCSKKTSIIAANMFSHGRGVALPTEIGFLGESYDGLQTHTNCYNACGLGRKMWYIMLCSNSPWSCWGLCMSDSWVLCIELVPLWACGWILMFSQQYFMPKPVWNVAKRSECQGAFEHVTSEAMDQQVSHFISDSINKQHD